MLSNREIPEKGKNNTWFEYNESDTVFVFVHGIFSDSNSCWLYLDKKNPSKNASSPEFMGKLRFRQFSQLVI